MSDLDKIQLSRQAQEEGYRFPYHHLVDFDVRNNASFRQSRNYPGGYSYAAYLIFVLEQLQALEFQSLADIGCGDGFFTTKVKERFPDKTITGIDISQKAIAFARAFAPDVEFLSADIRAEVSDRQFDVITLIEVLEHVPPAEIPEFVAALSGLLKAGGRLVVTVPSDKKSAAHSKRHFQHFNEQSLAAGLADHFRIQSIHYLNKKSYWWDYVICALLTNPLFVLNNSFLVNRLFGLYRRLFLKAQKHNGLRICAICEKKEGAAR